MDIDAEHAIHNMAYYGRGEGGGLTEAIYTLSEFDEVLRKAHKSDSTVVYRKLGVLNLDKAFDGWLNFSSFGPKRKKSKIAQLQGCREREPHFIHYFIANEGPHKGLVVLNYKIFETDLHTLPNNATNKCVVCLTSKVPSVQDVINLIPEISPPKPWLWLPIRDEMEKHWKFDPMARDEWRIFFSKVPKDKEDIAEADKFQWTFPAVNTTRIEGKTSKYPSEPLLPVDRSIQDGSYESILHPGFTPAEQKRKQEERIIEWRKSKSYGVPELDPAGP